MTKKKKIVKSVDSTSGRTTSPIPSTSSASSATAETASSAVSSATADSASPAAAKTTGTAQQPETIWMEIDDTGIEQLTLRDPTITMAQAQVELKSRLKAKVLMAQLLKDDIDDPEEDYPIEKITCPYVNKSFHKKSGCLIRIFNQDIPGVPEEIGVMRLEVAKPANIPAVLYKEKGKLKSWAIGQIKGAMKESGHNSIEDHRLTVEEFTARFSVTSLSAYGRTVLGDKEPGLWVLHAPLLIEPVVACRYEDGSEDKFILLRMYVNLVKPEKRIRQPPEGWVPKATVSDTEVEKRKYPQGARRDNRFASEKRPRPNDEQHISLKQHNEMMSKLAQDSARLAVENAITSYPALPATKNQAGMVTWPENDVPHISKKL
jgi:hypothetical protein